MNKKTVAAKAAGITLGVASAVLVGAAAATAVKLWKWSKDPYSTQLWLGCAPCGRGILIRKTDEPGEYRVQTGYRWHNDEHASDAEETGVPVMEIDLPEEYQAAAKDGDECAEAGEAEEPAPEAEAAAPEAGDEA
ncbi:MAG: hypothetical protein IKP17_00135 [Oscillospiraceae bacterium]|jgi:hypothetical protein|nr:hypothetical protein [Oscillospiraceae bacterium]MBR4691145.1 hypothetical protein [Oscillospiraceae bacterium]